jgi:hypothetical protein
MTAIVAVEAQIRKAQRASGQATGRVMRDE